MDVLFNVPNRNLSNTTLSSGLITLNNIVPVANCGGLLLRYDVSNIAAGESLSLTYSIYVDGEFRSGSTTLIEQSGPGAIGFDISGKNATTQIQATLVAVGTVRVSATLYSVAIGEDIV